jgi:probable F420-dependent oxidoreductase
MRLGFVLPQIGLLGTAANLVKAAQRAEALGYESLWVTERLLYPVKPRSPYPATPDGSLPEQYKLVLDPLETLTFVAAHTKRAALGTSVLDMPFYNPVLLARRFAALDVLSGGRARVGLGLGWSKDEYEAAGAVSKDRGAYADEFIQVLKTIWTRDPVEFHGKFFSIPKSVIGPKPLQKPHPPIILAAFAPAAQERVARRADGWNPVGMPAEAMAQTMAGLREKAKAHGRDPAALQLIVRANVYVREKPMGKDRWPFSGTLEQIQQDIQATRAIKADELFFDIVFSPDGASIKRFLKRMEEIRALA